MQRGIRSYENLLSSEAQKIFLESQDFRGKPLSKPLNGQSKQEIGPKIVSYTSLSEEPLESKNVQKSKIVELSSLESSELSSKQYQKIVKELKSSGTYQAIAKQLNDLKPHLKNDQRSISEMAPKSKNSRKQSHDYVRMEMNYHMDQLKSVENEESGKNEVSMENFYNDTSSEVPENVPTTFKCKLCSETFSSKIDVNKHLSTVHEGKKVIKINGREVTTGNQFIHNQILQYTMVENSDFVSEEPENSQEFVQNLKNHIAAMNGN